MLISTSVEKKNQTARNQIQSTELPVGFDVIKERTDANVDSNIKADFYKGHKK